MARNYRVTIGAVSAPVVDTTAPSQVTGLSATPSGTQVSLSWNVATDSGGSGLAGYKIYRALSSGFTPSPSNQIATVVSNSYTNTGLTQNTTYYYRVRAYDNAGNEGALSSQVSALVGDTSAPTAPSNVAGTGGTGTISLTWSASTDNVAVTGYRIYYAASTSFSPPGTGTLLGTSASNSYNGVIPAGTWYFKVAAYDAAGNTSAYSASSAAIVVSTTLLPQLKYAPPTMTTPVTITVQSTRAARLAASQPSGVTVSSSLSNNTIYTINAGIDANVVFQGVVDGALEFQGGRNLVIVGAEHVISDNTSGAAAWQNRRLLLFKNQTGTVHLEGYYGHAANTSGTISAIEGINLSMPATSSVFQMQNCRIGPVDFDPNVPDTHTDVLQTWAGPGEIRIYNCSWITGYQGAHLGIADGPYVGTVTTDRLNIKAWKADDVTYSGQLGAFYIFSPTNPTVHRIGQMYVNTGYYGAGNRQGLRAGIGWESSGTWYWREYQASGTAYAAETNAYQSTSYAKTDGDYMVFTRPSTDNIAALDGVSQARIYQGDPTGGDYVPSSVVGTGYVSPGVQPIGTYAFSEDFDGSSFDTETWVPMYPWYDNRYHLNDRYEVNLAEQITVHDGTLDIRAQAIPTNDPMWPGNGDYAADPVTGMYPYRSGLVQSGYVERESDRRPRLTWKYGRLDVRAQFPVGSGPYWSTSTSASKLWPAIWAMPFDNRIWTADGPEVDIMEAFGDTNEHVGWALHGGSGQSATYANIEYGGAYHIWSWDWQPGSMRFLVDNVQAGPTVTSNVPAIQYYLLINLAVGMYPSFGPPALPGTPTDAHLLVDYVHLTPYASTEVYKRGVKVYG